MTRVAKPLTENEILHLSKTPPRDHNGSPIQRKIYRVDACLYIEVRRGIGDALRTRWIYRQQAMSGKKGVSIELGFFPQMTLARAREAAVRCRLNWQDGVLPYQAAAIEREPEARSITLLAASDLWFVHAREVGYYKRDKYCRTEQQRFTVNMLAYCGSIRLDELEERDVCRAFAHCWQEAATRTRVIGTLRNVLRYAKHKKLAPDSILGLLDIKELQLELGATKRSEKKRPCLPVTEAPAFMRELREMPGIPARMLEFQILTALRSGNVRHLLWRQVHNLDKPQEAYISFDSTDMKVEDNGSFDVPLSDWVVGILRDMLDYRDDALPTEKQYVFPSVQKYGKPLSDAVPCLVIKKLHEKALSEGRKGWIDPQESNAAHRPVCATAHGIARATFCMWAYKTWKEAWSRPIELCLHHREQNTTRRSYDRSDYYEERREILDSWAAYLNT